MFLFVFINSFRFFQDVECLFGENFVSHVSTVLAALTILLCVVFGAFVCTYRPLGDWWSAREAARNLLAFIVNLEMQNGRQFRIASYDQKRTVMWSKVPMVNHHHKQLESKTIIARNQIIYIGGKRQSQSFSNLCRSWFKHVLTRVNFGLNLDRKDWK